MKEEDREFLTLTGEDGEETEFDLTDGESLESVFMEVTKEC